MTPPTSRSRGIVRSSHVASSARTARRGIALVAVLAILALAAALLAGAFATSTAASRATRSARAALVADAGVRRALASTIVAWSAAEESLLVGASLSRVLADTTSVALDAADTRVVVLRLSASLHLVAADVIVPASGAPLARRRMRVLVTRFTPIDTTMIRPPSTISRWPGGALY